MTHRRNIIAVNQWVQRCKPSFGNRSRSSNLLIVNHLSNIILLFILFIFNWKNERITSEMQIASQYLQESSQRLQEADGRQYNKEDAPSFIYSWFFTQIKKLPTVKNTQNRKFSEIPGLKEGQALTRFITIHYTSLFKSSLQKKSSTFWYKNLVKVDYSNLKLSGNSGAKCLMPGVFIMPSRHICCVTLPAASVFLALPFFLFSFHSPSNTLLSLPLKIPLPSRYE